MQIKWMGNSTFLLKTSFSKKILIDPFNPLKLLDIDTNADIITFSKDILNTGIDNLSKYNAKIIMRAESYKDENIKITGYSSLSDKVDGLKRGINYIYTYQMDNLKLCHLGYIGSIPNSEMINVLKNMDILFIPIGGNLCLSGSEAYKLSQLLAPKYIIPMCYKYNSSDFYFDTPLEYISKSKKTFNAASNEIDTNDLPKDFLLTVLMKY